MLINLMTQKEGSNYLISSDVFVMMEFSFGGDSGGGHS